MMDERGQESRGVAKSPDLRGVFCFTEVCDASKGWGYVLGLRAVVCFTKVCDASKGRGYVSENKNC